MLLSQLRINAQGLVPGHLGIGEAPPQLPSLLGGLADVSARVSLVIQELATCIYVKHKHMRTYV